LKITFWPKSGAGKTSLCFMLFFIIGYFVLWRVLDINIAEKTDVFVPYLALLIVLFLVLSIVFAYFGIISGKDRSVMAYLCIIASIVMLYFILFAGATALFPTLREILWPFLFDEVPLKYLY
jgi:glucan phosphoethanolaminetransferase (alkaline phosphatase superfamily)